MLTDYETAAMRAMQEEWLPGTAVIQTNVPASDGAGGFEASWSASGTVPCRVSYQAMGSGARGGEVELGAAIRDVAPWIVTLPYDTDVSTADRLVIAGGRVFEVVAVAASVTIQTAVRCACVEVR